MKLEDIKIGMKVVPIDKSVCTCFNQWRKFPRECPQFFNEHGFLYVVDIRGQTVILGHEPNLMDGDYFKLADLQPYKEKEIKQAQTTIIYELQPHIVTYTSESSIDDYNEIFVKNIEVDREETRVIFNGNTTIAILDDGAKGIAKCDPNDKYDAQIGQGIAISRARIKQLEKRIKLLASRSVKKYATGGLIKWDNSTLARALSARKALKSQ